MWWERQRWGWVQWGSGIEIDHYWGAGGCYGTSPVGLLCLSQQDLQSLNSEIIWNLCPSYPNLESPGYPKSSGTKGSWRKLQCHVLGVQGAKGCKSQFGLYTWRENKGLATRQTLFLSSPPAELKMQIIEVWWNLPPLSHMLFDKNDYNLWPVAINIYVFMVLYTCQSTVRSI